MAKTKSMKTAVSFAAAVLAMMPTPAWTADYSSEVQLQINRVYAKSVSYLATGRPTVIVTVTNRSAYPLRIIAVDCAFIKDGSPVATAIGGATNLPAGGSAIEEIFTTQGVPFDSVTCRVSSAIR